MFIYIGGYKESYHYFRNSCIIYDKSLDEYKEEFEGNTVYSFAYYADRKEIGKKWWAFAAPFLDYAVIIWKAKFNPFEIFGYPNTYKFNYADFYEHVSRMGAVIYHSLVHFRNEMNSDRSHVEYDAKFKKGLDEAIFAYWFHSDEKNEEGKRFRDVYGYDEEYKPEFNKRIKAGRNWYASNFFKMWD